MTENLSLKLLNFDTKVSSNNDDNNNKSQISEKQIKNESVWTKNANFGNYYTSASMSQYGYSPDKIPGTKLLLISKFGLQNVIEDWSILSKLSDKELSEIIKLKNKPENKNAPIFYLYEIVKGAEPDADYSDTIKDDCFESALANRNLSDEEYEELNEKLYGKKSPEVQKLFDDFKKKYPDIKLMVDNDVTLKKAKEIIKATEKFIKYQRKTNAKFANVIQFTKMKGCGGFYSDNKIFININESGDYFDEVISHENGHLKDDGNFGMIKKEIPKDIKKILRKILSDYATTKTTESLAELAAAIETPGDKDSMKMTKKIRLRKDENGNLILMIAKNSKVTKEEVEKLGEYLRSIICPEMIPDYNPQKHGSTDKYNETVIRDEKIVKEYLAKYFTPNEMNIIEKRNLLSSKFSRFTIEDIKSLVRLNDEEFNNINSRELLSLKNANNENFDGNSIKKFASLSKEEWKFIKDNNLLTRKNSNGRAFSGKTISFLAKKHKIVTERELLKRKNANDKLLNDIDLEYLVKLNNDEWKNVTTNRNLLTLKNADGKAFTGEDISEFAKLSDEEWENVKKRGLLKEKDADGDAFFGSDISELAMLSDEEWENVKKRGLLKEKNACGKALYGSDISELAKLSDNEWENVKKRGLLEKRNADGDAFDGSDISELAKLSDDEWKNVRKRDLLKKKDADGDAFCGEDIAELAKLRNFEWERAEERGLLKRKDAKGRAFRIKDVVQLAKLNFKEWNIVRKNRLLKCTNPDYNVSDIVFIINNWEIVHKRALLNKANGKLEFFNGTDIKKFAQLSDDEWKNVEKRNLLIMEKKGFSISADEIISLAKISNIEWEKIKNQYNPAYKIVLL